MQTKTLILPEHLDGKFFDADGWTKAPSTLDIREAATGKALGKLGLADAAIVGAAAKRAKEAQRQWVKMNPEEKRKLFIRAEEIMWSYEADISQWIMREVGATRGKAKFELNFASDEILEASAMPTAHHGDMLADRSNRLSYAKRVPYGVVAVITPFNVPMTLTSRAIAPALAAGNAVILKPNASAAICSGYVFARIFEEAGFPPGIFQVLPTEGKATETFETDPNIGMLHFTGSSATGRKIAEVAGKHLKKVSISGSGKNPLIVCEDVDLDRAVSIGVSSSFFFSGQVCMMPGRQLIQRKIVDAYLEKLTAQAKQLVVDDPFVNDKAAYGPMITESAAQRVEEIVQDAVAQGAKLHTGGKRRGPFFEPTVLSGVKPGMRAWAEEVFGPVAAVTPFDTDEEAIAMANDTEYGLSASVLSGSLGRAMKIADEIDSGMVHINNQAVDDAAYVPFGGTKQSGNGGRYGSGANWDEYTYWRWYTAEAEAPMLPFVHGK